jgi:hypothetical protein
MTINMYNKFFPYPLFRFLLIITCLVPLNSFKATTPIVLKDAPIAFKPSGYYIAEVIDERATANAIAQLVIKAPGNKTANQQTDLQGGALTAINKFIARNLAKDTSLKAVSISIKELKIIETPLTGNRADGQIKLSLSYGLQKEYGIEPLVNYQGGFHYIRLNDNMADVELHLRKTIINGLTFFNKWFIANAPHNVKLANKVKFTFTDYTEPVEGDTIYYSPRRPLTWADFQSKLAPRGPYAASVMPSIAYEQQSKIADGTIYVTLAMKAYVAKSSCWVKPGIHDNYSLNHEQRHFDVVKIIAEQFKQKILAQKLTPDTYEGFITMQYLDSYRDMYAMQQAYDKETGNGRHPDIQARWNERIDKELKASGLIVSNQM